MNDDQHEALRMAEFDAEADRPRQGWRRGVAAGDPRLESWVRKVGEVRAVVVGLAAKSDSSAGLWTFTTFEGRRITGKGESSRRGWAMDGADGAFPTVN